MSLGAMQDFPLRLTRILDHAEREHATREIVAARADGSTHRTDWKGIARDARRLASALVKMGVQPGDRVATLAMNHDRHLTAWFGVVGMGGVLHTLNPRLFDEQLTYIINHAEDRVILYDASFELIIERLKSELPSIRHYIRFDDEFDGVLDGESGDYAWYDGDERDPCGLCYTSGTTGHPKGVLYEHRATVLHAMSVVVPDIFNLSARSVILPVVPMFHANSWCIPYAVPLAGSKLVMCADNDAARICKLFNEEDVTHSAGVPTVWLIKSGGEWISSIELENAAVGCPGVAEAAAIGVPHPKWDERPLLLIVRDDDSDVDEDKIRDFLAAHVAKWWLPDAIEFVDELPHTGTGKLSKKDLRDRYRDYRFENAEAMVGRD